MEPLAMLAFAVLSLTIYFFASSFRLAPRQDAANLALVAVKAPIERVPTPVIRASPPKRTISPLPITNMDATRCPTLLRDYMELLVKQRELLDDREKIREEFRLYRHEKEKEAAESKKLASKKRKDKMGEEKGSQISVISSKTLGVQTEKVHVLSRTPIPSAESSPAVTPTTLETFDVFTDALRPIFNDVTDPRKPSTLPFIKDASDNGLTINSRWFKMFDKESVLELLKMKPLELIVLWRGDCQKYELTIEQICASVRQIRLSVSSTTDVFTGLRESGASKDRERYDALAKIHRIFRMPVDAVKADEDSEQYQFSETPIGDFTAVSIPRVRSHRPWE